MISIHEWRSIKENTTVPIAMDNTEPTDDDWQYYHTKIQGRAKTYLKWFVEEIENKDYPLIRKGFIVQEVMNALGLNMPQFVRIMSNIKRSIQKRQAMQTPNQPPTTPNMPSASPASSGVGQQI